MIDSQRTLGMHWLFVDREEAHWSMKAILLFKALSRGNFGDGTGEKYVYSYNAYAANYDYT